MLENRGGISLPDEFFAFGRYDSSAANVRQAIAITFVEGLRTLPGLATDDIGTSLPITSDFSID